jgi:hypothetical protein
MFDFPASPTDGQVYTPVGGPTYYWDATDTAWRLAGAKSGPGSGLDADTLDGHDTPYFAPQTALDTEASTRASADTTLQNNINLKADIASPTFTGDPKAPTPAVSDNDTSIATTAFVKSVAATIVPFPEAPTDGLTYGRKNATWATVIGGAYTDDLPPAPPLIDGQLWYKASTGVMYVYYDDGTSQQWVQVSASPQSPNSGFALKTASRKNLMVNGALNVSQENGNTEGTTTGYYAVDQFFINMNVASAAIGFGRIISANVSGSQYRLQLRVTTAKASLAAGETANIQTKIEGLNMQDLAWNQPAFGTPAPKDTLLAFGFNGPAGTYAITIRNNALTYTFAATFTITAGQAGVDTVQVIRVPAPPFSMGPWTTDNTVGMYITLCLAAGANFLAPATGWQSGTFAGVTGMSNGLAAVQSFQIWDIGLYADPDKTTLVPQFEVPDYATELVKCQRYYQVLAAGLRMDAYAVTVIGFSMTCLPMRTQPSGNASWTTATNISNGPFLGTGVNAIMFTANPTAAGQCTGILSAVKLNARM